MKITKTNKDANNSKIRKEIANQGCNKCPCCGETRSFYEAMEKGGKFQGILNATCKNYCKGIFKMKYMQIDCYKCETCGAEWESEPYEV